MPCGFGKKGKMLEKIESNSCSAPGQLVIPDGNGGFMPCPELLTEEELIRFLRIPEVSKSKDQHNVIENLKRMRDLPRVHICGKPLYPIQAVRDWIKEQTVNGK
jgi:hypothetical protein